MKKKKKSYFKHKMQLKKVPQQKYEKVDTKKK